MNRTLSCTIILSITFLVSSCSANQTVLEKEKAWESKLEQFQPIGKTRKQLFDWQNEVGVPLGSFPHKEGVILESVEGGSFVCSTWHIYLSIEVEATEKISEYSVSSAGSCL